MKQRRIEEEEKRTVFIARKKNNEEVLRSAIEAIQNKHICLSHA